MKYDISVTSSAARQIRSKLTNNNSFIRLGVKGGGCSGFKYELIFDSLPTEKDLVFLSEGINIVVDKKSILYLNGTCLDWEKKLMFTGFKFNNPLEQSKCGCGSSVFINKDKS